MSNRMQPDSCRTCAKKCASRSRESAMPYFGSVSSRWRMYCSRVTVRYAHLLQHLDVSFHCSSIENGVFTTAAAAFAIARRSVTSLLAGKGRHGGADAMAKPREWIRLRSLASFSRSICQGQWTQPARAPAARTERSHDLAGPEPLPGPSGMPMEAGLCHAAERHRALEKVRLHLSFCHGLWTTFPGRRRRDGRR